MKFYKIEDKIIEEASLLSDLKKENFKEVKVNSAKAEENKHVPFYEIINDTINVKCGKNELHPMTKEHFIEWFKLEIDGKIVETIDLSITGNPQVMFMVNNKEMLEKKIKIYAYCNIHGIWVSEN